MIDVEAQATDLDDRVRECLATSDTTRAATIALRALGPEVFGFLVGVVGPVDGEEVFSAFCERLWRSLSNFRGRCSVRTWAYVIARHEISRHRRGARRHQRGRVPISELEEILAVARSTHSSEAFTSRKKSALVHLREELPVEDRVLLVLRVDRKLAWNDIALAFAETPESLAPEDLRRESARLRKRFQLVRDRLVARVRGAVTEKD